MSIVENASGPEDRVGAAVSLEDGASANAGVFVKDAEARGLVDRRMSLVGHVAESKFPELPTVPRTTEYLSPVLHHDTRLWD